MARRDLAVTGFGHWRSEVDTHGAVAGLDPLYSAAVELVGDRARTWRSILDGDPAADLDASRAQVDALTDGSAGRAAIDRLAGSAIRSHSLLPDTRRMGCCGTLGTVIH